MSCGKTNDIFLVCGRFTSVRGPRRAWTRSFANVLRGTQFKNIKLGQIFGLSKNGSWALVDARNFFFLIYELRACTGSFGHEPKYTFGFGLL